MAFQQRKMYDVSSMNLKCAQCGTAITELPFQPSADRPVYCRDCNRARTKSFGGGRGGGGGGGRGGYGRGGGGRGGGRY
jgi:CxxC-x17-CxxC domain-containing protein